MERVAIVSGASCGTGRATAIRLARDFGEPTGADHGTGSLAGVPARPTSSGGAEP